MNTPDTIPEIIQPDEELIPEQTYLDKVTALRAELWDALAHPYRISCDARSKILALQDELDADQRPFTYREPVARQLEDTYQRLDALGDRLSAIMNEVDPDSSKEGDADG
jgi:hypothetical protein